MSAATQRTGEHDERRLDHRVDAEGRTEVGRHHRLLRHLPHALDSGDVDPGVAQGDDGGGREREPDRGAERPHADGLDDEHADDRVRAHADGLEHAEFTGAFEYRHDECIRHRHRHDDHEEPVDHQRRDAVDLDSLGELRNQLVPVEEPGAGRDGVRETGLDRHGPPGVRSLDDDAVHRVAELVGALHRGDRNLQDRAVELGLPGAEDSVHGEHQDGDPAGRHRAQGDDLVADPDPEVGREGGRDEGAVRPREVGAPDHLVRQGEHPSFALRVDAHDQSAEAALAGGHQGERLGPRRCRGDAGRPLELADQLAAAGHRVLDLRVVEVARILELKVARHQARRGLDPGVVGAVLQRRERRYEEDREADPGRGHPGAKPPAPEVAPGDADEHRPRRAGGARGDAGDGHAQRRPRSANVVNRRSSISASKSALV